MKKEVIYFSVFLFLVFAAVFAAASVVVKSFSLEDVYYPDDPLKGSVNLNVLNEKFNSLINSSDSEEILFGELLKKDGSLDYECSNLECYNKYSFSSGSNSLELNVLEGEDSYLGFVLYGSNVKVNGLSFDLESDFGEGESIPLFIDFFEGDVWTFSEFSDEFSNRDSGCYDSVYGKEGPLIRTSSYCEIISIKDTGALKVGAYVSEDDDKNLRMNVYPYEGGFPEGSCLFNPNTEDSCLIEADLGEIFASGEYQVCVEAPSPSDYKIFEEALGSKCGFVYEYGPYSSVKDYGIFLQTAKYAGGSSLDKGDFDFSSLKTWADEFISERYGGDCSSGCVLPLKIYGIPQGIEISEVAIDYTTKVGDYEENQIYSLDVIPSLVNFNGTIDLGLTGFIPKKSGTYSIYFNGEKIFSDLINVLSVPVVVSVSPLSPPAGLPVEFRVNTFYSGPRDLLEYTWEFGDGKSVQTKNSSVVHTYNTIKNYTLKVRASVGVGLSSEKSFNISAVDPSEAINSTLLEKRAYLDGIEEDINSLGLWYESSLISESRINFYRGELDKIEGSFLNPGNGSSVLDVALKLYSLDVPVGFETNVGAGELSLSDSLGIVDPDIIAGLEGASLKNLDEYRQLILDWQETNIDFRGSTEDYSLLFLDGSRENFFTNYRLDLISRGSEKSYLVVLGSGFSFKDLSSVKSAKGSSVVEIGPREQKIVEFYTNGPGSLDFFVSPSLKDVVIGSNIDETCNFNSVCEEEYGENPSTCRSDCKPTGKAIFYVFVAFLLFLIIYTLVQVWYKKNYENYLFSDKKQLYNLLMYVTNAKTRGLREGRIEKELEKKGWSKERISYIIRKSNGKSISLPEIVPIEKIMNFFRKRASKKNLMEKANASRRGGVVTGSEGQFRRNINKY